MQAALAPNPKYFKLHGEGPGEKAGAIIRNADRILASKLLLTKRNVICMSFVSEFATRCGTESAFLNNEPQAKVAELILNGEFSQAEMSTIERICRVEYAGEQFLAIRSSAHGDAAGTGVYETFYSKNNPAEVAKFVKMVIASHYTGDACLFRHDAGLEDGIAVIIEPLITQEMRSIGTMSNAAGAYHGNDKIFFAPALSGYAVAGMSGDKPLLYAGVAAGFASEFVKDPRQGLIAAFGDGEMEIRLGELLNKKTRGRAPGAYSIGASFTNSTICLDCEGTSWRGRIDLEFIQNLTLHGLLESLIQLFSNDTKAYVEWAAKSVGGKPAYFLNQLAQTIYPDYDFDADALSGNARFLGQSNSVVGDGKLCTEHIMHVKSRSGWNALSGMGESYKGSFLLFDGFAADTDVFSNTPYSCFSSSAVICELGKYGRMSLLAGHFGGKFAMARKVLLSITDDANIRQAFEHANKVHSSDGVDVYRLPVELFASERKQQAALLLAEKPQA